MKIFFADLDGTLLTSEKTISPDTKRALDAFVEAGNKFVISTGRPLDSAIVLRDRLGLNYPGSYITAFNGTQLYDNASGKVLYERGLSFDIVHELLALADEHEIHIHAYQDEFVISRHATPEFDYYIGHILMRGIVDRTLTDTLTKPPCKMLVISRDDHEKLAAFGRDLAAKFSDKVSFAYSSADFIDIYPLGSGKGAGLIKLCEILGIPVSDSVAAGDEHNDIPALEAAGCGIAMINAHEDVRAAADVVTELDNDHDGLLPFIESWT